MSEAELIAAAQGGDGRALEELLERHQDQVYRFGLRMCRDPEEAKEVLQDTLLALARGIGDLRGEASLSTWLYTVARNNCIKRRRKGRSAPANAPEEAAAEVVDPARNPEEAAEGKLVARALDEAIGALEPKYREVLVLRDVEGLTAPETAEVLGLTTEAVKSRLHRARATMRAQLAPLLEAPAEAAPGTCPDVVNIFSRHLEGEISAEVCAEMERHLERCPRCRGSCEALRSTLGLCRTAARSAKVPPGIQRSVRVALQSFLRAS